MNRPPCLPNWSEALRIVGADPQRFHPRMVDLLSLLRRHYGARVSRRMYDREFGQLSQDSFRVQIYRLRKALKGAHLQIINVPYGYQLKLINQGTH